jgi:hypothetical protein
MTVIGFAKIMTVSAFVGGAVLLAATGYALLFPHPVSMFDSKANKIMDIALIWTTGSFVLFMGAMIVNLWREEKL